MRRVAGAAVLVVADALALPAGAFAHATLIRESPSFRERVETAPRSVRLGFTESVDPVALSVRVYTARGRVVSGRPKLLDDGRIVQTPLRNVDRGAYTVGW